MTSYEIRVLLHYYYSAEDHGDMSRNPPIWRPTIESFKENDLLTETHRLAGVLYAITDRGRAYCEALQQVPLPEPQWIVRVPTDWTIFLKHPPSQSRSENP